MKRAVKKVNLEALELLRKAMYRAEVTELNLLDRDPTEMLDRMLSLAREHHKLSEAYCNGDLTEAQVKRQETIERIVAAYAEYFGMKAEFGGDPRGFTVKLHAPNKDMYNTWGGAESGYGI